MYIVGFLFRPLPQPHRSHNAGFFAQTNFRSSHIEILLPRLLRHQVVECRLFAHQFTPGLFLLVPILLRSPRRGPTAEDQRPVLVLHVYVGIFRRLHLHRLEVVSGLGELAGAAQLLLRKRRSRTV